MEPREPANGAAHVPRPPALRAPRRDPRRPRASRPPCSSLPRCWGPRHLPGAMPLTSLLRRTKPRPTSIRSSCRKHSVAATVGNTTRKSGRRGLERRRWLVPEATARRAARLTIPIAFAVAAIAATTIAIGGGGRSASPGGVLAQSIGGSRTANSLEKLKPGLLASNPFGVSTSTTRSAANASARAVAHRSRISSSRARRVVDRPSAGARGGGTHHTTTAADHPSASIPVTRAVTPQVESSRPALSTATPAQPVVSQHPSNSNANAEPAASSSRPAFGSDGLLGPGSSPDS